MKNQLVRLLVQVGVVAMLFGFADTGTAYGQDTADDFSVSFGARGFGRIAILKDSDEDEVRLKIVVTTEGEDKVATLPLPEMVDGSFCDDVVRVRVYSAPFPPVDPTSKDPHAPPGTELPPDTIPLAPPMATKAAGPKSMVPYIITVVGCENPESVQILKDISFLLIKASGESTELVAAKLLPVLDHKAQMAGGPLGKGDGSQFFIDIPALGLTRGAIQAGHMTGEMADVFSDLGLTVDVGDRFVVKLTFKTYIFCTLKGARELCAVIDWGVTMMFLVGETDAASTGGAFFSPSRMDTCLPMRIERILRRRRVGLRTRLSSRKET